MTSGDNRFKAKFPKDLLLARVHPVPMLPLEEVKATVDKKMGDSIAWFNTKTLRLSNCLLEVNKDFTLIPLVWEGKDVWRVVFLAVEAVHSARQGIAAEDQ